MTRKAHQIPIPPDNELPTQRAPVKRLDTQDKSRAVNLRLQSGLTYQEIADIIGTSKQTIHRNLKLLLPDETTDVYRDHRADILAAAQMRCLSYVTPDKLKKSSPRDLIVSAGILYDKERLERGQSTQNVDTHVQVARMEEELKAMERELKALEDEG